MSAQTETPRIAYLTGEYPKASHTFILREIAALRALGAEVCAASIRRTAKAQLIGPEEEGRHLGDCPFGAKHLFDPHERKKV
jgi:hypothetical protein